MYPNNSLLTFSFPLGRLMGVPLRLSFLMPVVVGALMWRLGSPVYGAAGGVIILFSLLAHETAHLWAARRSGVVPGVVVLWPLGGMQSHQLRLSFRESCLVSAAGPVSNFLIAVFCGWQLDQQGLLHGLLNPFGTFEISPTDSFSSACLRIAFVTNYCLVLFNLIPVRPLDAGQILSDFLNLRFMEMETRDLMLRTGLVVSLVGIVGGFVFDVSGLVALSSFLLVLHIHELSQWVQPQERDESFMGYDFSEGYTSLDRDEELNRTDDDDEESGFGILDRWKARREEERLQRESEEREHEALELDRILEKLHTEGRDSLTTRELSILNRVSARLRQRNVRD
jgi:stage IV sporulation protein FB